MAILLDHNNHIAEAVLTTAAMKKDVQRYLRTGQYDLYCLDWPGDIMNRERLAYGAYKTALLDKIRNAKIAKTLTLPNVDLVTLTRQKVEPMVRGMFPAD